MEQINLIAPDIIKKPHALRCDLCGRFTKDNEIVSMGGEYDEDWLECRDCMSESDFKIYFPNELR